MAIMVDDAAYPYRGQMYCHMMDTDNNLEELHAFAARLGLKPSWFQNKVRFPHYDLAPSKRKQAIALGAEEVSSREMVRRIMLLPCYKPNVSRETMEGNP